MKKKELNRLSELEDQALSCFADKLGFNVIDWLDEDDQREFCKLYNKQFNEKNCLCATHKEWM